MVVPTPRTPVRQGKSVNERLELLELRQWVAPQRLASVLNGAVDANELDGNGWFWLNSPSVTYPVATLNSPDPTQNYVVEQYELDSTTRYQLASRIGAPAGQIFTERWTRTRTAVGVWSAWKLISMPTTSFTPVPGAGGIVIGNGTASATYSVSDGILRGRISVNFGSTTTVGGDITFELPPIPYTGATMVAGDSRMVDASTGFAIAATVLVNSLLVYARPFATTSAAVGTATFTRSVAAGASTPFAWATGDSLTLDFEYPIL